MKATRDAGPVSERDSTHERRPYQPPRLRHLGSVRELTLGTTMGSNPEPSMAGVMVGIM